MYLKLAGLFLLSSLLGFAQAAIDSTPYKWVTHSEQLPKPLSDMSATLDEASGTIYIMGGCDNINGNERVTIPELDEFFSCPSITNAMYGFDLETGAIDMSLPSAPRERTRHTAALVDGKIWMIGGRDSEDSIIQEIDIFDIAKNEWDTTVTLSVPEDLARSDSASFTQGDEIFVTTGYLPDYTASATTYKIDTVQSLATGSLVTISLAEPTVASGDANAVSICGQAYLVGGFTHANQWCRALHNVTQYDIASNTWKEIVPLTYNRGDKALVALGSSIHAIGGESNTDCAGDPSQRTNPTTEVEVLDTNQQVLQWTETVVDIPDDHFRFPAVAHENKIYTFGGQQYYSALCDCFATRSTILIYEVPQEENTAAVCSAGGYFGGAWAASVLLVVGMLMI